MGEVMPVYLLIRPDFENGDEDSEHPNIAIVNNWWAMSNNRPFVRLDENRSNYGGSKTMCEQSYVGVFTGKTPGMVLDFLSELEWQENDVVQVMIKGDEELEFSLYNIKSANEYWRKEVEDFDLENNNI